VSLPKPLSVKQVDVSLHPAAYVFKGYVDHLQDLPHDLLHLGHSFFQVVSFDVHLHVICGYPYGNHR
jgi:hypothetical protein